MRKTAFLDLLFVAQLLVVGFVIVGVLPRTVVPFLVIVLAFYVLSAKLEDAVAFFARSIPFFVAMPITNSFDSFNTWRILSGLIFLKWFLRKDILAPIFKEAILFIRKPVNFFKEHRILSLVSLLLILAVASVSQAGAPLLAVKRIIYFINLGLIGIVTYNLVRKSGGFGQRLIKNLSIPVIIVALVGMAQLVSTYFMDIFQFVDFWAKKAELSLFGSAWANIALKANTWFAYYGDQLSLRMFSIFPDSHSFPIFLLLGLPAVFAVSLRKVVGIRNGLKTMFFARASLLIAFVPIIFLAAILSGTRGIWVASLGALLAVFLTLHATSSRNRSQIRQEEGGPERKRAVFKYISAYLLVFFLLFGVAYFIFASDQFQVSKSDSVMFGRRIRSVLDISETSNARRIQIWKDSVKSIIKHPLLGVGIGNFPVVVSEDLARAKAGSSAHNLYLHIAAEMGIPALILVLWFLWLLLKKAYLNFLQTTRYSLQTIYFASALIFIPWVLFYSLTDVAIFDERAFLLFVVTCGIMLGWRETGEARETG